MAQNRLFPKLSWWTMNTYFHKGDVRRELITSFCFLVRLTAMFFLHNVKSDFFLSQTDRYFIDRKEVITYFFVIEMYIHTCIYKIVTLLKNHETTKLT